MPFEVSRAWHILPIKIENLASPLADISYYVIAQIAVLDWSSVAEFASPGAHIVNGWPCIQCGEKNLLSKDIFKMKLQLWQSLSLVLLVSPLAMTGCGVTVGVGPVNQITLAIYPPLCVDVVDASTASGAAVQVYACGAGKRSQEWQLNSVDNNGGLNIVNVNSKMCMSVSDTPDTAPGQYVLQETCAVNGVQQNQVWTMVKAPGQAGYRFVSAASKQCLDLPYGAVASIDHLQQYYCTAGDPAQGWSVTAVALGNTP